MDFKVNPEQEMMVKIVRDLAEKEIAPRAEEVDLKGEFPWENIKAMNELGLLGLTTPEEYGGSLVDSVTYMAVIEEISKACAATGAIMAIHSSAGVMGIVNYGTEKQKQKYLPRLAEEGKIAAFALTEPGAGSDASSVKTTAVLDGDEYVLNGTKCFISNGGVADVYTVFAMTDRSKGVKGISAFIVEHGTPGFSYGKIENKMGIRGSATSELIFDNCRIPKENLLGNEGEGFKIAMQVLDGARIGVGAQAVGIAQAAYEAALQYSKEREQFGKPIFAFQAISFMLADMAIQIEAARLMVHKAAWLKDAGLPYGKEAAMAKTIASDMAQKVTADAVQIMGGYGYSKEYPVERYMRDAKITQIYEGTNQILRVVIANYLK
jgi:alkylation response protein AidB-like acyl-CoA dehydrogenase